MHRVLILHTSVGLGHKTIAENIAYHLREGGMEVQVADILAVESSSATDRGVRLYGFIQRSAPWIWDYLYSSNLVNFLLRPFRLWAASKHSEKTLQLIKGFAPDLVITTQTSASAVVAYLKRKELYTGLFAIAFSDFHYHDFWRYTEADYYIVNIQEQKQALTNKGVKPDRVTVCGMSLQAGMGNLESEVRSKLSLPDGARVVLVGSGSQAVVFPWGTADQLAEMVETDKNLCVLFLTGSNQGLFSQLSKKYNSPRIKILSYYQPLDELYRITNLFITKPGGLSIAESLRYNLPIIITHALPGQEALNIEYLKKNGLILGELNSLEKLEKLINDASFLEQFSEKVANNPLKETIVGQEKSGQGKVLAAVQNMLNVKLTASRKVQ